jgi:4-diphosphocytidyl-2-C-methyl-D-erythritol kinase
LCDALEFIKGEEIKFNYSGLEIEGNSDNNLIMKAYRLLKDDFDLPAINIHLHKSIPMGAGLGGGSADAAFMLKMLNDEFKLGLSSAELQQKAAKLGADCAFFIKNTPAYATGIGNILTPIDCKLTGYYMVVVKPDIHISTKEAYSLVSPGYPENRLADIISMPVEEWKGLMKNDFEKSVFAKYPSVMNIKNRLYDLGAVYASMSGSGSAFFGIFKEECDIEKIKRLFPDMFCQQWKL